MPLSLAQAAAETGLHRSSILRAIKRGTISGTRDASGAWVVEPAELFRVFTPAVRTGESADATRQGAQADAAAIQLAGMAVEVGMLREQLGDARRDRDDARQERDRWQEIASRLALPKPELDPVPEPVMGWWAWLRSTG
jgi:hypothetical protein